MATNGVTFGVHLPVRMLPGADIDPPSAALLTDTVDAAKESGFSSVWVTDHIAYMDPWLDCLMMLAAGPGTTLTVTAVGSDAAEAINELAQLVNRNFEEE